MKFVNQNVAEFLRDEIENFNIVKKVAYISNNEIKFEIFNPVVNVIFISNDKVDKSNYAKTLKKEVVKTCISRFMSKTDLANILLEICQVKLGISNSELSNYKILLPL